MRIWRGALICALIFGSRGPMSASLAAGPADDAKLTNYGRHLAQECTACHRLDGADRGIPSINGRDPDEFSKTLELYRSGERSNPVMTSVVKSLNTEQVRALAVYYASLPAMRTK